LQSVRTTDFWSVSQILSKEMVINEVQRRGKSLRHSSPKYWKGDEEVVLAAVSNDGFALAYASNELKNNKRIVLAAVHNKGRALMCASIELKSDEEVVLAAVENDGLSLLHAVDGMKACKRVALVAVKQNGLALSYVSATLKGDIDVCIAAAKQNKRALRYSARSLLWTNIRARLLSTDKGFALLLNGTYYESTKQLAATRAVSVNAVRCHYCALAILMNNGPYQAITVFMLIAGYADVSESTKRRLSVSHGMLKLSFALFDEESPAADTQSRALAINHV
jgi:hypothetical protein